MLRIGFGVNVRSDDDPYIKIAIDANMATAKGGNPGTALVDYWPSCKSPKVLSSMSEPDKTMRSSFRPRVSQFLEDAAACSKLEVGYQKLARHSLRRY